MTHDIAPRIVTDPVIRAGKPVLAGTRVPVDVIVGKLASGMAVEEVADEYGLMTDDVRAALAHVARHSAIGEAGA
jgi:uncharacterized protein (DUF433 family)